MTAAAESHEVALAQVSDGQETGHRQEAWIGNGPSSPLGHRRRFWGGHPNGRTADLAHQCVTLSLRKPYPPSPRCQPAGRRPVLLARLLLRRSASLSRLGTDGLQVNSEDRSGGGPDVVFGDSVGQLAQNESLLSDVHDTQVGDDALNNASAGQGQ